ncbi:MAG: hypothetical protein GX660_25350 [Clostridiaceae bacterium]|nr:hypothetical protein [Clostridiaceae bacterium]
MAGEKRFGSAMFGFKQSDVNSYIEKILREFDDKLKEKDAEIAALKNQCRELRIKYEDIARKSDQIGEDRAKIADVLIKAQEKAELIISEAKTQALDERKKLSYMTEKEKERLVDIKEEIKALKQEVTKTLKKYELDLNKVVEFAEAQENEVVVEENEEEVVDETSDDDIIEEIMEEYTTKPVIAESKD